MDEQAVFGVAQEAAAPAAVAGDRAPVARFVAGDRAAVSEGLDETGVLVTRAEDDVTLGDFLSAGRYSWRAEVRWERP